MHTQRSSLTTPVNTQYDVAGYFPDDSAIPRQGALACYARAVVHVEFPALADGVALHPLPTYWADQLLAEFERLSEAGDTDQPIGTILSVDKERRDARRLRITEAEPAVPWEVTVLMLLVSAAAVFAIGTFTLPYVSRPVQIGALGVIVLVFALMQATIYEIDRKSEGLITVEPTDLTISVDLLGDKFASDHPDEELPCDEEGRRI